MDDTLPDWPRPRLAADDEVGEPVVFLAVFGATADGLQVSRSRHRCGGVPDGIDVSAFDDAQHAGVLADFRSGYLWDTLLAKEPALAAAIAGARRCVVLRDGPRDATTLNYLRDVVGLVQALLENGGVGVYDPQRFKWWSPADWRRQVFEPGTPQPLQHVTVLDSAMLDGTHWLHTRGMRLFGRPDLSMHGVVVGQRGGFIAMINRLVELQALGGVVAEGQPIRMEGLPDGLRCHHRGDVDDPDFNNSHIEIAWQVR